jgi:hypothetical protein
MIGFIVVDAIMKSCLIPRQEIQRIELGTRYLPTECSQQSSPKGLVVIEPVSVMNLVIVWLSVKSSPHQRRIHWSSSCPVIALQDDLSMV